MRQFKFMRRCALLAVFAGSLTAASQAPAANDFEALLAEVSFGQEPAAGETLGLPPATEAETPAEMPLDSPGGATEALPEPPTPQYAPAPSAAPMPAHHAVAEPCGTCNSNHCGTNHGLHHQTFCQPYTPPRLPTSTFYQYWRSNSCNVNVWDGFRNHCHQCIDLTVKPKSHHGCLGGKCGNGCAVPGGDCGPLPEEWVAAKPCDTCD